MNIPKNRVTTLALNCAHRLALANAHCVLVYSGTVKERLQKKKKALNVTMHDIYQLEKHTIQMTEGTVKC